MTEEIKTFVAAVLGAPTPDAAVAMYLEAPKSVRRAAYNAIRSGNSVLGKKIRAAAEERRGIAFRTLDGDLVLDRDTVKAQALRLVGKMQEMDVRKTVLAKRVVELKKQAQKFYGDDFLVELEAVIEQA